MAIWPSRSGLLLVWSVGRGEALVVVVLEAVRGRVGFGLGGKVFFSSVSLSFSFGRMRLTRNSLVTPRDRDPITARGPKYVS